MTPGERRRKKAWRKRREKLRQAAMAALGPSPRLVTRFRVTLTEDRVLERPAPVELRLRMNGRKGKPVTWPANVTWGELIAKASLT